jgi:hypothetical protein
MPFAFHSTPRRSFTITFMISQPITEPITPITVYTRRAHEHPVIHQTSKQLG